MATTQTHPVEDSVAKVDKELAVGEDLEFQRKWWRFEKIAWVGFVVIVLLDLAGVFGRGPAAKAHAATRGGMMTVDYERVERFSTPSILTIHFSPRAVRNGAIQLWVSDSVIMELGNQRVTPQPVSSVVGNGGILYTFASTAQPDSVEFALEPASPGLLHFQLLMPADAGLAAPNLNATPLDEFQARVVVMP